MQVLVLGSAPGALIPSHDIVYCANSAGAMYKEELSLHSSKKVTLVSASELVKSRRDSDEKRNWLEKKRRDIFSLTNHEIKIISAEFFPDVYSNTLGVWKDLPVEYLAHEKFEKFIRDELNLGYPILSSALLKVAPVKMLIRFLMELYRYSTVRPYLAHSLFRQGTGLNALIEAVISHGVGASYKLSGISFYRRDDYKDGSKNTWTRSDLINLNHLCADKVVLDALRERYEISVNPQN